MSASSRLALASNSGTCQICGTVEHTVLMHQVGTAKGACSQAAACPDDRPGSTHHQCRPMQTTNTGSLPATPAGSAPVHAPALPPHTCWRGWGTPAVGQRNGEASGCDMHAAMRSSIAPVQYGGQLAPTAATVAVPPKLAAQACLAWLGSSDGRNPLHTRPAGMGEGALSMTGGGLKQGAE